MSLIADALRTAQEAREDRDAAGVETARRVLSPPDGTARGGLRGSLRVSAGRGVRLGSEVKLAGALFGVALIASTTLVAIAPPAGPAPAPSAPPAAVTTPGTAVALDAVSVEVGADAVPLPEAARPAAEAAFVALPSAPAPTPTIAAEAAPAAVPDAPVAVAAEPDDAAAGPAARDAAEAAGAGDPRPVGFELRVGPSDPGAGTFERALAAQRAGDAAGAVALYREAVAREPRRAEAHNNLGASLHALGRNAEARDALRRSVTLRPEYAAAWSNLGLVLAALGDAEGSRVALAEAVRLDPANAGAAVNLALHYQARGLFDDARALLERAVAAEPRHPEARYALARLLDERGDAANAARHYYLFLDAAGDRFPQLRAAVRARLERGTGDLDA